MPPEPRTLAGTRQSDRQYDSTFRRSTFFRMRLRSRLGIGCSLGRNIHFGCLSCCESWLETNRSRSWWLVSTIAIPSATTTSTPPIALPALRRRLLSGGCRWSFLRLCIIVILRICFWLGFVFRLTIFRFGVLGLRLRLLGLRVVGVILRVSVEERRLQWRRSRLLFLICAGSFFRLSGTWCAASCGRASTCAYGTYNTSDTSRASGMIKER